MEGPLDSQLNGTNYTKQSFSKFRGHKISVFLIQGNALAFVDGHLISLTALGGGYHPKVGGNHLTNYFYYFIMF